jgi:phage terminase large subunit GpA-like protein
MPIEESDKARLNAGGRWLAEGLSIVDGAIVGEAITSPIASYWLRGPAAVFQTWRGLLERYQSALRTYEENGEETRLRTTVNTDQAEPYIPQAILAKRSEGVLDQETLKARAEPGPINVVPAGTLFVVAAVDVQGTHFVVQLEAFARDLESTIFARFDVTRPNLSAGDADRLLDPARFLEDWDQLLDPVIRTAWPIADRPGHVMRAALVMYDTHGAAGVTDNAYRFWRRYREDDGERICPIRGAGGFKVPRFVMTHPNSGRKDRHAGARGEVPVLQVGVDHMKDMVDRGLRRTERGPGKTHLLARLPDRVFAELCAESREETGWVRVRKRNEAFDLSAYAKAGALHLTNGVDWSRPDRWPSFMRSEGNPHIITLPGAHPPIVPPGAVAAEPAPGSAALPTVSPEEGGGVVLPAEDKSVRQNRLLSALLGKTR